jgi:hypothetical protein
MLFKKKLKECMNEKGQNNCICVYIITKEMLLLLFFFHTI